MAPIPFPSLLRTWSVVLLLLGVARGVARSEEPRTPWTSSRITGTPETPRPYTVEPAFPKLTFLRPVAMAAIPGSKQLVVAEQGGTVRSFPNDPNVDRADLAIDLAKARPGFSALYGIAFHPRFVENGNVFLCYVLQNNKPDGTRVSRFTMSREDPRKIDPESERVLLTFLSGGHNGGCLQFGPDGFLYISSGDSADPSPPDPLRTGQDIGDLLSSILRIDVDREDPGKAYRVPSDNPFINTDGARPEVWAYGFRNPWRMSFDRTTGDLWVGDVGWELWEMIHRVERGGNYGWSIVEGHQSVRPEGDRGPTPIRPPIAEHPHSEAASITGGYVYRGTRLEDLSGSYVYGDFQSGKVWGLRYEGGRVTSRAELADTGLRIVSFGEDEAGEIYLIEYERSNQVFRLVPNKAPKPDREFPRTLSRTGLFSSTPDHRPASGVIPYEINAQSWDDGTHAERLLAIPGSGRIDVNAEGGWNLPDGSVLARTVSVDLVEGKSESRRRVETQILHREEGSWRPYTYAWDDSQGDATLVDADGATRTLVASAEHAPGGRREITYRMAARSQCLLCHNPWVSSRNTTFGRQSASPLAFNASQVDRDGKGGESQLRWLSSRAYFTKPPPAEGRTKLVDPYDDTANLNARARSYLQANCAHCHQANAGGTTPIALLASLELGKTRTVDVAPMQGSFGIADAKIIAPGEPERSVLYYRMAKTGAGRMPRIGSLHVDVRGARLIADWITQMPRTAATGSLAADEVAALNALKDGTGGSRSDRAEAIRRLTGSTRGALALLGAIDRGEVPAPTVREVAAASTMAAPEVRDLFERFVPEADRIRRLGDAIDPAVILSLAGDSSRGRALFFSETATQCKSCHRAGGAGVGLGPDLDAIGGKYPRPELLRHILEPSRDVDPKFAILAIATKRGEVFTGLLRDQTAEEIVLRDAQDRPTRIRVSDIEEKQTRPGSLMPEGLLRDLTAQQAADLLEFLSTLKGP